MVSEPVLDEGSTNKPGNSVSRIRWVSISLTALCLIATLWLPLHRFWPYFEGKICVENDLGEFHLPMFLFISHAIRDADTTFWNPVYACGFNLLGEGQVALLHPLRQFWFAVANVDLILMLDVVLPTLLFQGGFFVLCRTMGVSVPIAVTCSYFVAFSSSIHARHFHANYLYTLAHAPWLMVCFRKYDSSLSRRGRILMLPTIAILKASQVLFGSPPYLFYASILESTFLLTLFLSGTGKRRTVELLFAYGAGILIGFPQIWETVLEANKSFRAARAEIDYFSFPLRPFGFLNLFQAFNPFIVSASFPGDAYDNYERFVCSVGAGLTLCTLGRWRTSKSLAMRRWALLLFLFSMLLAYLTMIPLVRDVYDALPVIGRFRINQRYGCIAITSIGLYLALALESFRKGEFEVSRTFRLSNISLSIVLIALSSVTPVFCLAGSAELHSVPASIREPMAKLATAFAPVSWQFLGVAFMAISVGIVSCRALGRNAKTDALCLLLMIQTFCLGQSFTHSKYWSYPRIIERFDPSVAKRSELRDAFLNHYSSNGEMRLEAKNPITSNAGFVNGYFAMLPRYQVLPQNDSLLRIAAASRIFVRDVESEPFDDFEHEAPTISGSERILDLPLSRFRLVRNSVVAPDPDKELDRIDSRMTVILPEGPEIHSSSDGGLKIDRIRNGNKKFSVISDEPQFLVIADTWHPGWTCIIDGNPAPIHKAYGRYQAVLIPEGAHGVELNFEPDSLRYGIYVSIFGTALLLATAGVAFVRKNEAVPSEPGSDRIEAPADSVDDVRSSSEFN